MSKRAFTVGAIAAVLGLVIIFGLFFAWLDARNDANRALVDLRESKQTIQELERQNADLKEEVEESEKTADDLLSDLDELCAALGQTEGIEGVDAWFDANVLTYGRLCDQFQYSGKI